jgi:hypothetical protein
MTTGVEPNRTLTKRPSTGCTQGADMVAGVACSRPFFGSTGIAQKPSPLVSIACFIFIMLHLVEAMRFILFGAVCTLATAQQVLRDPIKNFCRRHQHQSCIIDSKLYIDGGLEYFGAGVESGSKPERSI